MKTLIHEEKESGIYTVEWNGKDNSGRTMPSGIYFYRLSSGDTVTTRKMVLLK